MPPPAAATTRGWPGAPAIRRCSRSCRPTRQGTSTRARGATPIPPPRTSRTASGCAPACGPPSIAGWPAAGRGRSRGETARRGWPATQRSAPSSTRTRTQLGRGGSKDEAERARVRLVDGVPPDMDAAGGIEAMALDHHDPQAGERLAAPAHRRAVAVWAVRPVDRRPERFAHAREGGRDVVSCPRPARDGRLPRKAEDEPSLRGVIVDEIAKASPGGGV